jgi:hypothetical protein
MPSFGRYRGKADVAWTSIPRNLLALNVNHCRSAADHIELTRCRAAHVY